MCMLPSYLHVVILISSSLTPILLSRFIINLRQVDSPNTDTSANQHQSRFSMPNFRMPTMNDIVGNLGEPLDFDVEHRLDDEDDAPEGSANLNADTELQDANVAGPSRVTGPADIEAAGPSGSGGFDVIVLDINDIELEEVCFVGPGYQRSTF